MKAAILFSLAAFILISLSARGQARVKKPTLNGKTFIIQLINTSGEKKGRKWTDDEISFNGGRLDSKVMSAKEGFPTAKCTLTVDSAAENSIHFQGKHQNAGGSEIIWEGIVTGDAIEGTAEWTNIDDTRSFSFTGTLAGKKKK
jgi:hypothetical protein